jgi:hypothetical protein
MRQHDYKSDGKCVFCREDLSGFRADEVTDEHIIPRALNGTLLIRNGVCGPCARLSNKLYENRALSNDLFVPRRLLELKKSRNRGKHQKSPEPLPLVALGNQVMSGGDGVFNIQLSDDEYPYRFSLILFPPPGKLEKEDRGAGIKEIRLQSFDLGGNQGRRKDVTTREPYMNGPFALMLTKIAYCYAFAERGANGFDGDEIRDLLMGRRDDVYNFVGNPAKLEVLGNQHLHALYFREERDWLTVLVHLFASCNANPEVPSAPYQVVVGKVR